MSRHRPRRPPLAIRSIGFICFVRSLYFPLGFLGFFLFLAGSGGASTPVPPSPAALGIFLFFLFLGARLGHLRLCLAIKLSSLFSIVGLDVSLGGVSRFVLFPGVLTVFASSSPSPRIVDPRRRLDLFTQVTSKFAHTSRDQRPTRPNPMTNDQMDSLITTIRSTSEGKPEAQRLWFSEPDLRVIAGSSNGAATLWYHSPLLASKSQVHGRRALRAHAGAEGADDRVPRRRSRDLGEEDEVPGFAGRGAWDDGVVRSTIGTDSRRGRGRTTGFWLGTSEGQMILLSSIW